MWSVVIVDDDEKVLRGMKKVIPWEELNCQWIGEARNGKEGLELIEKKQPDIIITDIYMPIMNGLEMIEGLKEAGSESKVIILSGYSDFEYARQALRLSIDDYLSKPASVDTIRSALQGIIGKLEAGKSKNKAKSARSIELNFQTPLGSVSVGEIKNRRSGRSGAMIKIIDSNVMEAKSSQPRTQPILNTTKGLSESIETSKKLHEAIRFADEELASSIIDDFFQKMDEETYYKTAGVSIGIEIWTIIVYAFHGIGKSIEDMLPSNFDLYAELSKIKSWEMVADFLKKHIRQFCQSVHLDNNLRHNQLVEQVVKYVHENISRNIRLGEISEELLISRNYLGKIFKEVSGESFKDYITGVRMEQAKKMLCSGNYLIYEVANQVGYTNPTYFTTVFKNHMGYTPSDLINRNFIS